MLIIQDEPVRYGLYDKTVYDVNTYRKRPVHVKAVRLVSQNFNEVLLFCNYLLRYDDAVGRYHVYDKLHDTWVALEEGDYIIQGIQGEFYPCKDGVFIETYEIVQDEDQGFEDPY